MTAKPVRLVTYGTFDLFHYGHVRLLRRLAERCDELYIGCSTDGFNAIKGKAAIVGYQERVEILESLKYVTRVFPEDRWEQKRDDILKYKIDIFAMGDDWQGKFDDLKDICDVLYLPRTRDVSTTEIRERVVSRHGGTPGNG